VGREGDEPENLSISSDLMLCAVVSVLDPYPDAADRVSAALVDAEPAYEDAASAWGDAVVVSAEDAVVVSAVEVDVELDADLPVDPLPSLLPRVLAEMNSHAD